MILILSTATAILSIICFVLFRMLGTERQNTNEYHSIIVTLEKDKERMDNELQKNKDVYSFERKTLMITNEKLNSQLKHLKDQLEEFTEVKMNYYSQMDNLNNFAKEMSIDDFMEIRKKMSNDVEIQDFTGIYILKNKTYEKFYIGQSISLFKRVENHFTGRGNKDIFEDYSNGDIWTIKLIALSESGFKSINALEKHFIKYHSSTYNGYNKTIGNAN